MVTRLATRQQSEETKEQKVEAAGGMPEHVSLLKENGRTPITEREEGEGGRRQLMDGVAQQGSEVMRALSELIGHSLHIHFLLLVYSWAFRESPGVEAGFIYLCL